MPAIGIIGGMGPQASARLLELIIKGTKAFTPAARDEDFPEIILLNVPVPNFISNTKNLAATQAMLIKRTKILEEAGCTINAIACNTAHLMLPAIQASTTVPFLPIPELVAEKVKQEGFKKVGLLATPVTLSTDLFDQALSGIADIVRPEPETINKLEALIYKQLNNNIGPKERAELRKIVREFKSENKQDAVILGCTELPLIFGPSNDPAVIDTLQVLADGLLERFFEFKKSNLQVFQALAD